MSESQALCPISDYGNSSGHTSQKLIGGPSVPTQQTTGSEYDSSVLIPRPAYDPTTASGHTYPYANAAYQYNNTAYQYNNPTYQYNGSSGTNTSCAQVQYAAGGPPPPPPPPTILCPTLYNTINQNQIHLHVHGSQMNKLDHYLSGEGSLALSSAAQAASRSIEIGIVGTAALTDQEAHSDPSSVWRPYTVQY